MIHVSKKSMKEFSVNSVDENTKQKNLLENCDDLVDKEKHNREHKEYLNKDIFLKSQMKYNLYQKKLITIVRPINKYNKRRLN